MKVENFHLAPRQWIKNDGKQLSWLRNYLEQQVRIELMYSDGSIFKVGSYLHCTYEDLIRVLEEKLATSQGIIELTQMKAAWSQAKYRSNLKGKDKKAYNFVMSTDVKNQLRRVAKHLNLPANKTIEHLIKTEYENLFKINRASTFPEHQNNQTNSNYPPASTYQNYYGPLNTHHSSGYTPINNQPYPHPHLPTRLADTYKEAKEREEAKQRRAEQFSKSLRNLSLHKGSAKITRREKIQNLNARTKPV